MRTRIDGFDQAQRNYDAMEEPCGAEVDSWPCIDCDRDVGQDERAHAPRRTCPSCERPLCLTCADQDEEISERCSECCKKEHHAETH